MDVTPGCQDAAIGSTMGSTPHKTETGEKREENQKPSDVTFLEGTDGSTDLSAVRHPQQREVELAAAPGGLYRAAVDSPSKLDPRGFEDPDVSANSGNWASLNSDGSSLAITPLSSTPCSTQVVGLPSTPCSIQIVGSMSSTSSSTLAMSSRWPAPFSVSEQRQRQGELCRNVSQPVLRDVLAGGNADAMVRQLSDEHLATLDESIVMSKKWRSGYWKNWYRDLVLEVGVMDDGEDCVVESFLECDERVEEAEPGICRQSWSNAGSPPACRTSRTPAVRTLIVEAIVGIFPGSRVRGMPQV